MRLFKGLLIFALLATPCWADDPDKLMSYPPQKIMGFRGLDTRSTKPTIEDSRAGDLLNVVLSPALDLKKRNGYSVINGIVDDLWTGQGAITGIFDSLYSDGTSWTYVFIEDKVRYDNVGTWTDVTSPLFTTEGQNYQKKCIMALDYTVCTDDTNVPFKISSTPTKTVLDTSDLGDALTNVRTLIWFNNYLIVGNTKEATVERPTRVRWSNVGTIETWTDDDFVDISTFAGDEIIGFAELYGDLYVFLTKSIWKVSLVGGDELFVFRKVIDNIGAISTHSVQVLTLSDSRSVVAFTDDQKRVLMFNGATVTDIGNIIQPSLNGLSDARLQYSVATFDGEQYIFCATTSGGSTNDVCYVFNTEIGEWTKWTQIDANAIARVKGTDSTIKTYFGNYKGFVYWLDDTDKIVDVVGQIGIVDSIGTINTTTITGAQAIITGDLTSEEYTGATIRITSGTGVGEESVIATNLSANTGVAVMSAFSTTPDSTSSFSIGDINAYYVAKPYDLGDASRQKDYLGILFWGAESSSNTVDVSYAIDFGSTIQSETVDLSPSSSSLWDVALWDQGTWGTTGDKIYTVKMSGTGNVIEPKFLNNKIDETFHLYGFNLLAIGGDTKQ